MCYITCTKHGVVKRDNWPPGQDYDGMRGTEGPVNGTSRENGTGDNPIVRLLGLG